MISHAWSVVCEKVIIDRDSNNVSMDALEQVVVSEMPPHATDEVLLFPIRVTILSLWYRTDPDVGGSASIRIRLVDPAGEEIVASEMLVDLREHERYRTRLNMPGLPAKVSGRHFVMVDLGTSGNWVEVAKIPLRVKFDGN